MPANQTKLADKYHTTPLADDEVSTRGKCTVVGIDIDEKEMPKGRFIWYHIENDANKGGVLCGNTFCSWRVKDAVSIRKEAIKCATVRLGDKQLAEQQVDVVIKAGGMI